MVKLTRETTHRLRNQGKTFAEIGEMFDVSRQYANALYKGYYRHYQRSEKYKMYKRHYYGHSSPYKSCDYCTSIDSSSIA